MAIQLATSGSAEVLWSSPGSGRNACGAGSIELASPGAHCDTRCRVFDDKSCTLTTTFPRLLKGGALEPIGGGERGADAVPIASRWQLAPGPSCDPYTCRRQPDMTLGPPRLRVHATGRTCLFGPPLAPAWATRWLNKELV